VFDADSPLLVQADPTRVKDGGGQYGVRDGRETCSVIVYRLRLLSADAPRSVDELLNRNITVTALAIKMATLRRRIFHAEGAKISFKSGQTYIYKNVLERVRPRFPGVIDCNIVSAVSLVDIDIALEPE